MRTELTERFGIEYPIFAFSHCRDVVAAVSKAGGFGVFGSGSSMPEQLEIELSWIDEHVQGYPYGVDVLMPESVSGGNVEELAKLIPQGHRDFVAGLVERFHIPPPKAVNSSRIRIHANAGSHDVSRSLLETAFAHDVSLIACALGAPPRDVVEEAHRRGVAVAGLVGEAKHARKQAEAGVDIVIAVGSEGGGHVGTKVSTMVLVPAVVDVVAPLPVLAAGGIGTGRQVAAALALGAEGVWCGSVWLTTIESDIEPIVKEKLLRAGARDTVISRWRSGKTQRWLRSPWVDAWEEPGAPPPLPRALQTLLVQDAYVAMHQHCVAEVISTVAGQIVESMTQVRKCRDIVDELALGFIDAATRMAEIAGIDQVTSISGQQGAEEPTAPKG